MNKKFKVLGILVATGVLILGGQSVFAKVTDINTDDNMEEVKYKQKAPKEHKVITQAIEKEQVEEGNLVAEDEALSSYDGNLHLYNLHLAIDGIEGATWSEETKENAINEIIERLDSINHNGEDKEKLEIIKELISDLMPNDDGKIQELHEIVHELDVKYNNKESYNDGLSTGENSIKAGVNESNE